MVNLVSWCVSEFIHWQHVKAEDHFILFGGNGSMHRYSENWITQTAGDHQKSLSYEEFEL